MKQVRGSVFGQVCWTEGLCQHSRLQVGLLDRMWGYASVCGIWGKSWMDKRAMPGTWRICEHVCSCEPRECCVCAFMSELLSLSTGEEKGFSAVSVLQVLCISVVESSPWLGLPLWLVVSVSCLCMSLEHVLSFAYSWICKGKIASHIPKPGQRPHIPRLDRSNPRPEQMKEVATCSCHALFSLNSYLILTGTKVRGKISLCIM